MMGLISRLRRSVALFLCPQLAVKSAANDAIQRALADYDVQLADRLDMLLEMGATPSGQKMLADKGFIYRDGLNLRFRLPQGSKALTLDPAETLLFRSSAFFDAGAAKRQHDRAFETARKAGRPTWRDVSRVCLPGWLIRRAVEASASPLYRAGPSIVQRLERHLERLDDTCAQGRLAGLTRSVALWLIQSPNDGQQATPEQRCPEPSSQPMPDPLQAFGPKGSSFEETE